MPKSYKIMKSSKLRSFLIGLLVLASIFSYTYVNTATIPSDQIRTSEKEENVDIPKQENNMILPEVQIVKKIMESSKKLLPAS